MALAILEYAKRQRPEAFPLGASSKVVLSMPEPGQIAARIEIFSDPPTNSPPVAEPKRQPVTVKVPFRLPVPSAATPAS
jgi:hypothetical protein